MPALPTFFIIGAPKAGTTSLHLYLDQHPGIQMSANKEPRFFAGPEDGIPYAPGRVTTLREYEALFDPTVPVRGEASTDYAFHPRRQGVPARIKRLVPDASFLYLVRDPIARTISHYKMRVAFLGERRPLAQALADLADRSSPYLWPSLYASQLERYLSVFPYERIMVVDQADLLTDRASTLRGIFSFLGVDPDVTSERFEERLSDSREWRAYSPRYSRLVDRFLAPAARWMPPDARRAARRAVERRLWPAVGTPRLDEELEQRLRGVFGDEAVRLRALTGQAFASWSV
jgi:sulfotransferase family protein